MSKVCEAGARFVLFSDALQCSMMLSKPGADEWYHIDYDTTPTSDRYQTEPYVVVKDAKPQRASSCSVSMGAKPEPTWFEKFLKAIGLID